MTKVVTGWIRVKMVNSLLFFSQFSCMVSIKTIDSEAVDPDQIASVRDLNCFFKKGYIWFQLENYAKIEFN